MRTRGLNWQQVRPLIEEAFEEVPEVKVLLFPPVSTPDAKEMPIRTKRPHLTTARALFLKLMQQYASFHYRLTLLEIQKLAYFLQEAGEPLRLNYKEAHYGPYAVNLNKVLEIMEGHYIRGYGDSQKPDAEIELQPGAADEADRFLDDKESSKERLEKVARLIEGFETPYGMELLSSVHWLAVHGQTPATDAEIAIEFMMRWNPRKNKMFKPDHIRVAWDRLQAEGWIN